MNEENRKMLAGYRRGGGGGCEHGIRYSSDAVPNRKVRKREPVPSALFPHSLRAERRAILGDAAQEVYSVYGFEPLEKRRRRRFSHCSPSKDTNDASLNRKHIAIVINDGLISPISPNGSSFTFSKPE